MAKRYTCDGDVFVEIVVAISFCALFFVGFSQPLMVMIANGWVW